MPHKVVKRGGGYKVCDSSGKCYSGKPMSKAKAKAQSKAIYASKSRRAGKS